ncbi:hypothetical protein [Chitinophaga sp. YR627]|uniref:hypothetical protein n=1 Tax=Chitinophaga sp. YR627 TaxID=1881041 RepID=UPI0015A67E38|nr:hypothetical protein [Chitinophaga sp. YR627]
MKDKKVEDKVRSLIEKARAVERPIKVKTSARRRSSLNKIIKTKEQADALMSALKAL